ncbi:hypothetical protein GCM10008171_06810 [Methylopila jiangsuensis]|uniref:HpcH/HpaI aldolase/citrate lyase domain-containing protein n=1 Tax=Methylopila jiangsuensis TaxID=586230 RepID=A0A9W6JEB3_9HYPH|nr:aldolase/citrate lyase family protein [Methylopila jiangsuensis]MDR6285667.1 citrate lyase subunit beta/citryl-CoA lyase [Methylopila jiangsuensis]GLK75427.1 hypothetical protein GCM10008171_06810 [Methylopila jiangsuensis]
MKALLSAQTLPTDDLTSRSHGVAGWIANPSALGAPWPSGAPPLYLTVDDLDAKGVDDALARAARHGAAGVLLRRLRASADIERLAARLAVAEARAGSADGALAIVALVAGAAGLLALPALAGRRPRLAALGWDAAALAADLGAAEARDPCGGWIEPLRHARSQVLFAAAALDVPAIDAPADLDDEAFAAEAALGLRHGFRAKIALSPRQAEILAAL